MSSKVPIILGNALVVLGVYYYHWDLPILLFIFWVEAIIIAIIGFSKVVESSRNVNNPFHLDNENISKEFSQGMMHFIFNNFITRFSKKYKDTAALTYYVSYFLILFLIFIFVSGLGVYFFIYVNSNIRSILELVYSYSFISVILVLALGHLHSYYRNFVCQREFLKRSPGTQVNVSFRRFWFVFIFTYVVAFFYLLFHKSSALLLIFIILKTIYDIYEHREEHSKHLAYCELQDNS